MLLPRTWAILSSVFSKTGDEYVRIRLVEYLRIFFFSRISPEGLLWARSVLLSVLSTSLRSWLSVHYAECIFQKLAFRFPCSCFFLAIVTGLNKPL